MTRVFVLGVGMTKFEKPGARDSFDYPDMVRESVTKALLDAGINYDNVQFAVCGYCYGDSTCGQRALYSFGQTQIPIVNVNNNCSTGSTALYMAAQTIKSGLYDCALAVGFEKMAPGSLSSVFNDRTNPLDQIVQSMAEHRGIEKGPLAAQIFGNAAIEHQEKYGSKPIHLAQIAQKNHLHSTRNPYSQFRDEYTLQQVQESRQVFGPLTLLQCCPTSDGSAAAVICSQQFLRKLGEKAFGQAIEIVSQSMTTDGPNYLQSSIEAAGSAMTKKAADQVYKQAGIGPAQVQVVELHDCFSANELITYEALGLCNEGEGHHLIESGNATFGGRYVINPSGGLISKGHPLGATGLAQCLELSYQLRGWCGARQVPNVKYALQHNIGLGGAAVVTLYRKGYPQHKAYDPIERFGYNPAVECRSVTENDFALVQSNRLSKSKSKL